MFFHVSFALVLLSSSALTSRGLEQKRNKMCVLDMDEKGNLYLYKFALLCKNEIIKRLINGSYHLAESSEGPSTIGQSKENPALNCKDLKQKAPSLVSGVYWIDPDGGSHGNAFQAYCDQQTDGGGWTLVWSYTFTAYSSFTSGANAVTPRPSWSASAANTRVSTTVPLNETDYEAMSFALWRSIGKEFLIKSNINNWIACKEGTGSLVQQKKGSIACKLVKQVSQQCAGVVPNSLRPYAYGPVIESSGLYYYFDSYTSSDWPVHDPCAKGQENQLKARKSSCDVISRRHTDSRRQKLTKLIPRCSLFPLPLKQEGKRERAWDRDTLGINLKGKSRH